MIALSILVPAVSTRAFTFGQRIQEMLFGQWNRLTPADQKRVEILVLTDTKSITLGTKRNLLLDMAQGDYIAFVDDDDRLAPDYLQTLLDATLNTGRDVITFDVDVSIDRQPSKPCYYSIRYPQDKNTNYAYYRLPNHLMVVKRNLAARAGFPVLDRGEDAEYARRLKPFLETEHHIDRVLYYYDYDSQTTETQRAQQ